MINNTCIFAVNESHEHLYFVRARWGVQEAQKILQQHWRKLNSLFKAALSSTGPILPDTIPDILEQLTKSYHRLDSLLYRVGTGEKKTSIVCASNLTAPEVECLVSSKSSLIQALYEEKDILLLDCEEQWLAKQLAEFSSFCLDYEAIQIAAQDFYSKLSSLQVADDLLKISSHSILNAITCNDKPVFSDKWLANQIKVHIKSIDRLCSGEHTPDDMPQKEIGAHLLPIQIKINQDEINAICAQQLSAAVSHLRSKEQAKVFNKAMRLSLIGQHKDYYYYDARQFFSQKVSCKTGVALLCRATDNNISVSLLRTKKINQDNSSHLDSQLENLNFHLQKCWLDIQTPAPSQQQNQAYKNKVKKI